VPVREKSTSPPLANGWGPCSSVPVRESPLPPACGGGQAGTAASTPYPACDAPSRPHRSHAPALPAVPAGTASMWPRVTNGNPGETHSYDRRSPVPPSAPLRTTTRQLLVFLRRILPVKSEIQFPPSLSYWCSFVFIRFKIFPASDRAPRRPAVLCVLCVLCGYSHLQTQDPRPKTLSSNPEP
jgi:hypothetical protein